jgi:hypothetical protein
MIAVVSFAVADSKVRPGWIAFFIVLGLCVATVLLWRSMNHQLSKISVKRAAELDQPSDEELGGEGSGDERSGDERPADDQADDSSP